MFDWKKSLKKGLKTAVTTAVVTTGITMADTEKMVTNAIVSIVVGGIRSLFNWWKNK